MPQLKYGTTEYNRDRGNLPELPVVNMTVEQGLTEEAPILQSRPGLANTGVTMGAGPVKRLYQIDGVLAGDMYGVSANAFYKAGSSLGAMNGSGPASIAGFENRIFATQGQSLYQYDGATFATLATPGSVNVASLCVGTSRLIIISKDTGRIYWSDVLSNTIDTLSFATAENTPDRLKECLFIGDTLHLFGSETVEFWPAATSNPNLPFQPLVGRTYQVGIRGTGCATAFATTFAWITNNNQICVGDPQNPVSDAGLDEKIAASTNASLWTFVLDGTEFLACTLDTQTYVFSKRSSQWSTFASNGVANWIPQCYSDGVFGSSVNGALMAWTALHEDFGGVLERRFRAGLAIAVGTVPMMNIELKANAGRTPFTVGDYATPEVLMRVSRDGGDTWGAWKTISLGTQGQYRKNLRWTSLGHFGHPGILVEFKVTDPVPFRVSDLYMNDNLATV